MKRIVCLCCLVIMGFGCATSKQKIEAKPMRKDDGIFKRGVDYIPVNRASMNEYCPYSSMDDKHRQLYQENRMTF